MTTRNKVTLAGVIVLVLGLNLSIGSLAVGVLSTGALTFLQALFLAGTAMTVVGLCILVYDVVKGAVGVFEKEHN